MSGPKCGEYELTEAQRRRMEEQRLTEEERRKCEHQCSQIDKYMESIIPLLDQVDRLQKAAGGLSEEKSCLQNLKSGTTSYLSDVRQKCAHMDLPHLRKQNEELIDKFAKIQKELAQTAEMVSEAEVAYRMQAMQVVGAGFGANWDELVPSEKKESVVAESLKNTKKEQVKIQKDLSGIKLVEAALARLSIEDLTPEYRERLKKFQGRAQKYVNDPVTMKSFYELEIAPFEKECARFMKLKQEYEFVYEKYRKLKIEFEEPVEEAQVSEESLAQLKAEIAGLEKRKREEDEQEYIYAALNTVMEEMQYELVGTKETERRSGTYIGELYQIENGKAVRVTYSPDHQITMEIVGMDDKDREPSQEEAQSQEETMIQFCDGFPEILRRLQTYGVTLKNVTRFPASLKYARIVNIDQYDMQQDVELSAGETKVKRSADQKKGKKKRKRKLDITGRVIYDE